MTLICRTPNTRERSKATLENALEESKKKKKKERQGFRLIDESDVKEATLVSEADDEEEEKR